MNFGEYFTSVRWLLGHPTKSASKARASEGGPSQVGGHQQEQAEGDDCHQHGLAEEGDHARHGVRHLVLAGSGRLEL